MFAITILAAAAMASVGLNHAEVSGDDYLASIEQWHAARVERLRKPDGWLSLIGLHWLEHGRSSIGSGKDNDIVLAKGPERLGTIEWNQDGTVSIELAADNGAAIQGSELRKVELLDDSHDEPTVATFDGASFYLISRGDKKGLRVKDPNAPSRVGFTRIERFPVDPDWRIEGKWVPFDPVHYLEVPTIVGTVGKYPVPGKVVFEKDGKSFEILPVVEVPGGDELFVMFADRTSGKETYGAARFLYIDMPKNGKAVIDFNKAYNPPCAFTPYATCPLAPPENRLDIRVTAGEKKYHGPGNH